MVLLDTSIWIEFLKANEPYFKEVESLMESRSIVTFEPIFGELLQGSLNTNETNMILNFWNYIPKIEESELFIKAGELSFEQKLVSKGIRLIDASIIYATMNNSCKLWTLDKKILNYLDDNFVYNSNLKIQ